MAAVRATAGDQVAGAGEMRALTRLIAASPAVMAVYSGPDHLITYVNPTWERVVGKPGALGRPFRDVFPEMAGTGLLERLAEVYATGVSYQVDELALPIQRRPDGPVEESYWSFLWDRAALLDAAGTGDATAGGGISASGLGRDILCHAIDVTDQVRARREGERLLGESERARAALEIANADLQYRQREFELAYQQLQDAAAELEMQGEELRATAAHLEEKTEEAEEARRSAEAARARTAGVLEAMSDGYFALDADFRIVAVNAAMERKVGLTRDAMLGRVLWEVFPATVGTAYERHYRAAARDRTTEHFTDSYDDGRLALTTEADVYPVEGGGVAVFWRDITARVQAEAALRESEALARQLFALSPVPKWVYDAETLAFLDVNEAAVRHYGYAREEFLGMTIRDIRPPEEIPRMLGVAQAAHPAGGSHGLFRHRTRSGAIIDVEIFLRDVTYQGRRAVIVVVQDVTERRRTEAALAEAGRAAEAARDEAEAANRAKGEFLAVMSHELRTPLNAIGGYVELIELGIHGPVTDAQRTALARIQTSQRHLLGLIAGVLDYSRVEAGAVTYQFGDVPVAEAVADAESLVAPQLRAKGLGYAWSGAAPGLRVRADREKLQQILLNLLGNAIKFTDARDGVPGRVDVSCTVDGGRVAIHVRDTGTGISPEALERVFEPFVQADQRLTRPHAGVGLGLAISRDLARGMGGDLTVDSALGRGSTFTLALPRA